jgi:hypothetical protein
MTLGGALAAVTSVRTALLVAGLAVLASGALLPWRPAHDQSRVPAATG